MTPPQKSGFRIDEPFTLQRHGALLRQPFEGNNYKLRNNFGAKGYFTPKLGGMC